MYPTSRGAGEQGSRGAGEQGSRGAGEQGSRGAGERIDSNSLISLYTRIFLQKRDAPGLVSSVGIVPKKLSHSQRKNRAKMDTCFWTAH